MDNIGNAVYYNSDSNDTDSVEKVYYEISEEEVVDSDNNDSEDGEQINNLFTKPIGAHK